MALQKFTLAALAELDDGYADELDTDDEARLDDAIDDTELDEQLDHVG